MSSIPSRLFVMLLLIFSGMLAKGQYPEWNDPNSLPKWMTPEEETRRHEIGRDYVPTSLPPGPVRNIAEFERQKGVLIRYPLGIPLNLVASMSQHVTVYTIVSSTSVQNSAISDYQGAGVNMNNCQFIIASTNSYWTRDYGPWFVTTGNNSVAITDFTYNRPRPLDNAIPGVVANLLGVSKYNMNLSHAGGNYMCDGNGIAASTDLVVEENGSNLLFVQQQALDYLGIHTYHITIDPLGDYIKHIDCWAKFLDVDKILITRVPVSDSRYAAYEQVASYYSNQISSFGTPFQVFRVYSPNGQPYTNSLILNHRVYVPITGSTDDTQALAVYQQAMPGYEVLGFTGSWQSTDALHCRTIGIADIGMLYVKHIPLQGVYEYHPQFEVETEIIPYSGAALYSDSLFLICKTNITGFDTLPLVLHTGNTYKGYIPVMPGQETFTYYLFAADASGRRETFPLIGQAGARTFSVIPPEDLSIDPETIMFNTFEQTTDGINLNLTNITDNPVTVTGITLNGQGQIPWRIEPSDLEFPLEIAAGNTLPLMVYVTLDERSETRSPFLSDSIVIYTNLNIHAVGIEVLDDVFYYYLPANPNNLAVTNIGGNHLVVEWIKNADNNIVLLAWSETGEFGTPVEGVTYHTGNTIPGGGQVLYVGGQNSYQHNNLIPLKNYYYKAWSVNSERKYSSGRTTQATTTCGSFQPAYSENFNASESIPVCWTISNPVGTISWQVGEFSNGLSGTGFYAFANGNANNNTKQMNLVSPPINLSNYSSVNLSFSHRYRHQTNCSANVSYSVDGGNNWVVLQNYTSSSTNPATFNQTIPSLALQPDVRFRWQYLQTGSNTSSNRNWSVDNIQITGTALPAITGIGWANLNGPVSGEAEPGQSFTVSGMVWIENTTGGNEPTPGLQAWVGFSTSNTHPDGWSYWIPMQYYQPLNEDDEFIADLGSHLNEEGIYYFASRYQIDDQDYVYGGFSEAGGGFWNGLDNISGILNVQAAGPPANRYVQDEIIISGMENCFDAIDTIFVSNFYVAPGGSANFIAGGSIFFIQGTIVAEGCNLLAHITTNSEYCINTPGMAASINSYEPEAERTIDHPFQIKIFPNPTRGFLYVEIMNTNLHYPLKTEVYNSYGVMIEYAEHWISSTFSFDLSGLKPGIYFIRIMHGNVTKSEKILKF